MRIEEKEQGLRMRVSINEREEVGGAAAQTKYFVQGTLEECHEILDLLNDQALDRDDRERMLDQASGKVIELEATRLGESIPAAGMREGIDPAAMSLDNDKHHVDIDRLLSAVHAVYYAAWWQPDRPTDVKELWTELRDAAGLTPGRATALLGPNRNHMTGLPKPGGEPPLFFELRRFFEEVLGTPFNPTTPVNSATAHLTAKMFMARWRSRGGLPAVPGDDYYLDVLKNKQQPSVKRDMFAAAE